MTDRFRDTWSARCVWTQDAREFSEAGANLTGWILDCTVFDRVELIASSDVAQPVAFGIAEPTAK